MVSETPEEYRRRAAECRRLADQTTDDHARETLLYVASRWLALAELDEPTPGPPNGKEAPTVQPE
jgi:hypothetical protein